LEASGSEALPRKDDASVATVGSKVVGVNDECADGDEGAV